VDGWHSTIYGHKEPAVSLSVSALNKKRAMFWTILSAQPVIINDFNRHNLIVNGIKLSLGENRLIKTDAL
jgi:hypothetical protein